MDETLNLFLRSQALRTDERGWAIWEELESAYALSAAQAAVLICDMWDKHWARGASERVNEMAPRMNEVVRAARARGVQIIHAPSETLAFYEGHPARLRILEAPRVKTPKPARLPNPPQPLDSSDGGSDTGEKPWFQAWTRQHPAIEIDPGRDVISAEGQEIFSFLCSRGIRQVLVMGVHTNMCVLNRSFGIKNWVRWGVPVALVRDLTDPMYNPARPPYVNRPEAVRLIVEYIEKFWCPTIGSEDLTG
jgi:nicotinamidase-related amidase